MPVEHAVPVQQSETWTLEDIRRAFERYSQAVNASSLAPSTKTTYLVHADRFVRWLAGEVVVPAHRSTLGRGDR
jgi:hypothetical protein